MKIFYIRCYSGDKQYSQKMDRTSLDIVLQKKKKNPTLSRAGEHRLQIILVKHTT